MYRPNFASDTNIQLAQAKGDARKEKETYEIREKMGNLQYKSQQRNNYHSMFQTGLQIAKLGTDVYTQHKTAKDNNELNQANLEVQKMLQGATDIMKHNPNASVDYAQSLDDQDNLVRGKKSEELYQKALKQGENLKGQYKTKFEQNLFSSFSQFQSNADNLNISDTLETADINYKESSTGIIEGIGTNEEKKSQLKSLTKGLVDSGVITQSKKLELDLANSDMIETRSFSNMADNMMGLDGSGDISSVVSDINKSTDLNELQKERLVSDIEGLKEARITDSINKRNQVIEKAVTDEITVIEDMDRKDDLTISYLKSLPRSLNERQSKYRRSKINELEARAEKGKKPKTKTAHRNPELHLSLEDMSTNRNVYKEEARFTLDDIYEEQQKLPEKERDIFPEDYLYYKNLINKKEEDPGASAYIETLRVSFNPTSEDKKDSSLVLAKKAKYEGAMKELFDLRDDYRIKCLNKGIEPDDNELDRLTNQYVENVIKKDVFDFVDAKLNINDRDINSSVYGAGIFKFNNYTMLEKTVDAMNNGELRTASPATQRETTSFLTNAYKDVLKTQNMELGEVEQNVDLSLKFKIKGKKGWHRFATVDKTLQLQESMDGTNFTRVEFKEKSKEEKFKSSNKYTGGKVKTKDITQILNKDQQQEAKERVKFIENKYKNHPDFMKSEIASLASEYGLNETGLTFNELVEAMQQLTHEDNMKFWSDYGS